MLTACRFYGYPARLRPEPNRNARISRPALRPWALSSCSHRSAAGVDVTQTHTEAVGEPHATTDDLRREAIAFVEYGAGRPLGHGDIRADRQRLDHVCASATRDQSN